MIFHQSDLPSFTVVDLATRTRVLYRQALALPPVFSHPLLLADTRITFLLSVVMVLGWWGFVSTVLPLLSMRRQPILLYCLAKPEVQR